MIYDIFAGPGGWDVAAVDLGLEVTGIEISDDACATRRCAGLKTRQIDVRNVDPPALVGLIGSPPCPDFSVGGKHRGLDGDTGHLIFQVPRFVRRSRPTWFAFEQVPAVLPWWQKFAIEFQSWGYHCWSGILDAADFSVPQSRRRAFLLGRLHSPIAPPEPDPHIRSVSDALGWPVTTLFGFPRRADPGREVVEIDGIAYRARDLRTADRLAFTLTEKARSWGVWEQGVRRPLSISEAARLQTFDGEYPFQGSRTSIFHQIGNAVPPALSKRVLKAVIV